MCRVKAHRLRTSLERTWNVPSQIAAAGPDMACCRNHARNNMNCKLSIAAGWALIAAPYKFRIPTDAVTRLVWIPA